MFSHGREADRPYVDASGVARDLVVHRHGLGRRGWRRTRGRPADKLRPFLVFARPTARSGPESGKQMMGREVKH